MAYTTVPKSTDYFNTKLYTGNATGRTISGVGFQPDWSWIKNRSDTSGHRLLDAVRGATKELISNATNAEATEAQSLQSWNSDGFVLGTAAGVNANTNNFVSWNWKANGQGSSNTDGSINTTYTSANTTSGCSIITYTGTGANATIGHGLGMVPTFIIFRRYAQAENWNVYHKSAGADKSLRLNEKGASASDSTALNSTAPTSSLISLGSSVNTNANGNPMIAWCFSDVQGFSKAGSYTGNGNADGTFVYTGFKPAWLMLKKTNGSESWIMVDTTRGLYNSAYKYLLADTTGAEAGDLAYDILSNGFKFRGTSQNGSGDTFIYMAFAEAPLVGSNNVPATAR